MRFAYADPPYIGQAKKHYGEFGGAEVDHEKLILELEQYDGWALSLSSTTLQQILELCPKDVRIAAWVKPFCSFKPGVNPAYAWEPVIWKSARPRTREQLTVRDWIAEPITLQRGLAGAKPDAFCHWLFDLLNIQDGDTLDDLFPGTRAVSRAFAQPILWEVPA
jgi:hypothetical protein